jgi:nucleoside-diphosphate-sugar epimerase
MVTINQLAEMVMDIADKKLAIDHISGPLGVRGRNSDNRLIYTKLGWKPTQPLRIGLRKTYEWIEKQVDKSVGPDINVIGTCRVKKSVGLQLK